MQSLNEPIKNDGDEFGIEYGDLIEDTETPQPEELILAEDRHNILMKNMDQSLTQRQKEILCMRYGLTTGEPMTLDEVGKFYHLTRERVRQIEETALRRMRCRFYKKNIRMEDL